LNEKKAATNHKNFDFFKGRVHCFSIQIVINKCFLLNPEKKKFGADPSCHFRENAKTHTLIPKNNVNELKAKLL